MNILTRKRLQFRTTFIIIINLFIKFVRSEKVIDELLNSNCLFYGCNCDKNTIKCPSDDNSMKLAMFPKRHFLSNYYLNQNRISLDISHNSLETIPDDRFAFVDFICLNFSNNILSKISPDAFRDINKLNTLDLSHNKINYLNLETFKPLIDSLINLQMEFNQLHNMETSRLSIILKSFKKLENLDISQNQLVYLPQISAMKNLKYLNLENNNIEFLTDSDTNEPLLPITLIKLNLKKNQLKHLNEKSFVLMPKLQYLNLAHNQITEISENSFAHLTRLIELNLSFNCLKHLPSRIFYTLTSLDQLDLSSQKLSLKIIDNFAFERKSNQRSINMINLKNNKISKISDQAFCSKNSLNPYANIKIIDLSDNLLKNLDFCVFRQLFIGNQRNQTRVMIKVNSSKIECNCDLAKISQLVELQGECRRSIDQQIFDLNYYSCNQNETLTKEMIHSFCSNLTQYECLKQPIITTKPFLIYLKQINILDVNSPSNYTSNILKRVSSVSKEETFSSNNFYSHFLKNSTERTLNESCNSYLHKFSFIILNFGLFLVWYFIFNIEIILI